MTCLKKTIYQVCPVCFCCYLGLALFLSTASQVYAQNGTGKELVALASINSTGSTVTEGDVAVIVERFRSELFYTGKVTIMEREEMMEQLREQGFQQSVTCSNTQCLVQMGLVLGVNKIISGSIGRLGGLLIVNFRLIDVQNAKIEKEISRDIGEGIEGVVKVLPSMAYEIIGMKVPEEKKYVPPMAVVEKTQVKQPLSNTDTAKGFLVVDIKPRDAVTLVNGKEYGSGNKTIDLPAGEYQISGKLNKDSAKVQFVKITPREKTNVEVRVKEKTKFTFSTDFSGMISGNDEQVGPSLQIGWKRKHNYFGFSAYAGFNENGFGGGGFNYGYVFNFGDILLLTPGGVVGFWYESGYDDHSYSYYSYYDYDDSSVSDKYYFGGFHPRIEIGYKHVFLNLDLVVLVGSSTKVLLSSGISFCF